MKAEDSCFSRLLKSGTEAAAALAAREAAEEAERADRRSRLKARLLKEVEIAPSPILASLSASPLWNHMCQFDQTAPDGGLQAVWTPLSALQIAAPRTTLPKSFLLPSKGLCTARMCNHTP